jgi:hypothetical protein
MNLKNQLLLNGQFGGMTANEQRLGRFIRDGEGHPDPAPVSSPDPGPAPEPSADDAFDAAFKEHATETPATDPAPAAPGTEPPAQPADGAAPDGTTETPAEPAAPAGGDSGGDPPAPAPSADDKGGAPAAPAKDEPAPATADDVLKGLADILKQNQQAPTEQPAAPAAEAPPIYTADEQAVLEEYAKNWPDVARAEELKRRAEYADIFKYVFTEVASYVAPLFDQMKVVGNTLHTQELTQKVPDYTENLEADVAAWVETQPAYLQPAYKQVMKGGTSDEVADLIERYRAATGTAPAEPAPAAPAAGAPAASPAPAAAPKTELSSAAKQAAESLAPVSGDRSAVPQGEEVQDFDTAFAKYATAGV